MTTTATTTTTTAVDRLLVAVTTPGTSASDIYADDAVFDATVPGWRFTVRGSQAIGYQLAEWYYYEGALEELVRHPTPTGEVIEYTITWQEDGVPHAAHHVNVLTVDPSTDRITSDHAWCGGRWPADLLARMEEARDDG
jgi:hypothetical protein